MTLFLSLLLLAQDPVDLRIAEEGWGETSTADLRKVLDSAARALLANLPNAKLPPIEVSRSQTGPITLYKRGPAGEVRVKLDSQDRRWAQFAFQFGHELCHVVCAGTDVPNPNMWFEESLCEVASLAVLGRMADEWAVTPPYPGWKGYAASLRKYRDDRLAQSKLPEGVTPAQWLKTHEARLRSDPHLRELNCNAASVMLPLFEEQPASWACLPALNTVRGDAIRSFSKYLGDWSRSSPEKHRAFIGKLAARLGVDPD